MWREITVAVALIAISGGVYFIKRGFDDTYLQVAQLESVADEIYIRQDVYLQTSKNQRRWELQDRIDSLKGKADFEGRDLSPYEKQQILNWQSEIRRLGN